MKNKFKDVSCLVVATGYNAEAVANRIEKVAFSYEMKVQETLINDSMMVEKLKHYIDTGKVSAILVRDLEEIFTNEDAIKELLQFAKAHDVSINEEKKGYQAAIIWDDSDGC